MAASPIDEAMEAQDWVRAKALWADERQRDPTAFWPRFWHAVMENRVGDRSAAMAEMEGLLGSDGADEVVVRSAIVEFCLESEFTDRALDEFRRLLSIAPLDSKAEFRLATWIIRQFLNVPGFPPSVFDLPPDLRKYTRLEAQIP